MANKNKSFEYLLQKLMEWFARSNNHNMPNDLSVLKSLKLLFLVTAADIEVKKNNDEQTLLIDTTFNRFNAMPLGHVESDIYTYITGTNGQLNYFNINKQGLERNQTPFINFNDVDVQSIDNAMQFLEALNPDLINYQPFELVDLTHKWDSWRFFYSGRDKASYAIPAQVIKHEVKYFR